MYCVKMYMGPDIGWLALTHLDGEVLLFKSELEADNHVRLLSFNTNKLIYEVEEYHG